MARVVQGGVENLGLILHRQGAPNTCRIDPASKRVGGWTLVLPELLTCLGWAFSGPAGTIVQSQDMTPSPL